MSKFNVGDKIRMYGAGSEGRSFRAPATIEKIVDGMIYTTTGVWCHPKQCRRLVKRKRRSVWIESHHDGSLRSVFRVGDPRPSSAIEFREVLPCRKK